MDPCEYNKLEGTAAYGRLLLAPVTITPQTAHYLTALTSFSPSDCGVNITS